MENQQTQPTCDVESGNQTGLHQRKASALIASPTLHHCFLPIQSRFLTANHEGSEYSRHSTPQLKVMQVLTVKVNDSNGFVCRSNILTLIPLMVILSFGSLINIRKRRSSN